MIANTIPGGSHTYVCVARVSVCVEREWSIISRYPL